MTPATPSDYSDDRLLAFLRRKLAGEPLPAAAAPHFHATDIYAAEPAILTSVHEPAPGKRGDGDSWFFFTHVKPKSSRDTRKSRQVAGGVGTWHSERAPRAVSDEEGNCIGHFQYFSYKMKTGKNCSERTQWYMMEFSNGNQEGSHDRINGGEPMLVLCKIYKAHANSRSSTPSKRKLANVLLNQVPLPVKAKRRLFYSPVPISSVAASQKPEPSQDEAELEASHQQVRCYQLDEEPMHEEPETSQENLNARASYNLQLQGKINDTLDSAFRFNLEPSHSKVSESIIQRFWTDVTEELEASQEKLLQNKRNATLDLAFNSELETSPDKVSVSIIQRFWREAETEATEEPEGSQEKLLQAKSNATLDSALRSELEQSQDEVSESIIQRFWTSEAEASQVDRASQEKLLQADRNATLDFAIRSELEQSQDKVSESMIQRFWTSEAEASRVDRATMNCSILMAGGALPMPAHCAPEVVLFSTWIGNDITGSCSPAPPMPAQCAPGALSSASWIGNGIAASCSSELGRGVGAPTYNELGDIAFGGFTGKPEVCSIPFAPVPPSAAASWFFSGPDIWSC